MTLDLPRRGRGSSSRRRFYRVVAFPHGALSTCPKFDLAGSTFFRSLGSRRASICITGAACLVLSLLRFRGNDKIVGAEMRTYSDHNATSPPDPMVVEAVGRAVVDDF